MGRTVQSGRRAAVPRRNDATVTLGTRQQQLFGPRSGHQFEATIVGVHAETGTFIVRNMHDGSYFMVPRRMLDLGGEPRITTLLPETTAGYPFPFRVNQRVPFTIGAEPGWTIKDENGKLMNGTKTSAVITHRIFDRATRRRWYVLRISQRMWDRNDPESWWSGYDLRREENVK